MYQLATTLTLLVTILLSLTAQAAANPSGPWQWLQGEFTNYQQTLAEPEQGHLPLRYSLTMLANEANDGVLMVSRQYYLFDPSTPLRQRVYQFTERRDGWRQQIYDVAIDDLDNAAAWTEVAGCHMQWERTATGYVGQTNPARCFFVVAEQDTRIAVHSTMRLTKDSVSVADVVSATTEIISDSATVATEFQRMTYYDDTILFRPTPDDDWREVSAVHATHDQGGRVGLIDTQSGLELRYQIELIRDGSEVELNLYDVTRQEVVYQTRAQAKEGVLEYESASLRLRLKPRP